MNFAAQRYYRLAYSDSVLNAAELGADILADIVRRKGQLTPMALACLEGHVRYIRTVIACAREGDVIRG